MSASSVTGLSGPGSAEGLNRGPGNGRNTYVSLISPHVFTAETVTVGGAGTVLVTFTDPVPGDKANYVVLLTNNTGARAPWVSTKTNDTAGNFNSFTITGTASDVVSYAVVSVGRTPAAPLL